MVAWAIQQTNPPKDTTTVLWTVVVVLAGVVAALAAYIARLYKAYSRKINEVYDARIADLKGNNSLVETIIRVVGNEKKGGGR